MVKKVVSETNAWIKWAKKLHYKRYRLQEDVFLVEGIRTVETALDAKAQLEAAYYSARLLENERGKSLLKRIKTASTNVMTVTDKLLGEISDTQTFQGIVVVAKKPRVQMDSSVMNGFPLVVVDRIKDPGNVGTIVRTADAGGAEAVIFLKGSADPFSPKAVRGSMGSVFHIPIMTEYNVECLEKFVKEAGYMIITGDSKAQHYYYHTDLSKNIALVIGNEAHGVSSEVKDISDKEVCIPIVGKSESLNAGVACGVLLFEAARQRSLV